MESALVLLISLMLVQGSTQLLHYVKSNHLSSQDCPGRPCLTLDQYLHDAEEYFATGTTFVFLDGQHTLQRTVKLTSVSDITLTQEEDYPQVNLMCRSEGTFILENVSNVTIKGLVFTSQSDTKRQNPSLLFFVSSRQIRLLNVTFQGNGQFRAIHSNQSFLTIMSCHFEDNIGDSGGALYAEYSVIMLNGNNFTQNKATKHGGAIRALKSSINIFLEENSTDYYNPSLQGNETMFTDNPLATVFLGNEASRDGGAIYLGDSTLTMSGTIVIFANNSANRYGGAICCRQHSLIRSTAKHLHFLNNEARDSGGAIILIVSSLYFGPNHTLVPDRKIFAEKVKVKTTITTIFSLNHAELGGGAVFLHNATAYLSGASMTFDSNTAKDGGALLLQVSSAVVSNAEHLSFSNNVAGDGGGAVASLNSFLTFGNAYNRKFAVNSVNESGAMEHQNSGYVDSTVFLTANPLYSAFPDSNKAKMNIFTIFYHNHAEYDGGAVILHNSVAYLSGTSMIFDSNSAKQGGALKLQTSSSVFSETEHLSFMNNVAASSGGAIASLKSFLTFGDTYGIFAGNAANKGGAIACENSEISLTTKNMKFFNNTAGDIGGAIFLTISSLYFGNKVSNRSPFPDTNADCDMLAKKMNVEDVMNITIIFSHNQAGFSGGGIFFSSATAYLSGANMTFDSNSAEQGGALMLQDLSAVVSNTEHLSFNNNVADFGGGAVASLNSCTILGDNTCSTNHYFVNNSCSHKGGAIYHSIGLLAVLGNSLFAENHAGSDGGVIFKESNNFHLSCTATFTNNRAKLGGAILLLNTSVALTGRFEFRNNSAESENEQCSNMSGGAIYSLGSQLKAQTQALKFIENSAVCSGGAITAGQGSQLTILSANFIQNKAKLGGAILLEGKSTVTISGTRFDHNSGESGGAIYTTFSFITLMDDTVFSSNSASYGGAIYGFYAAKFMFNGLTVFDNNIAEGNGGGIYTTNANITFNNTVQFTSNSALNGGAMFFESGTTLTIEQGTNFTTSYNHAAEYGGVIYHVDSGVTGQCEYNREMDDLNHLLARIPYCFIDLNGITTSKDVVYFPVYIKSYYDSASKDGSYIYGGFMDKCQMSVSNKDSIGMTLISVMGPFKESLIFTPINNTHKGISSKPYQLCFCQNHSYVDCFGNYTVQVYRGQKFNMSLVATAQGDLYVTSSTQVTVNINPTARLDLNQSTQLIKNCSAVTYNVYSTEEYEELVVYPADGPCIDRGFARAVIQVTLLPCPDGFTQSREQCVCEERLQAYDADCTIDEMMLITKRSINNFWMSALYVNQSYQGLILYKICPTEYCKSETVSMSLDDVNIQCDFNRTGILCGACATNYSLLLGSSTCQICSNMYLSLLVPFALAGLGLVIFLTFLRLTVATGLINSLILYANIVQANESLFFPPNTRNLLTVFIAWMNLDLGFKTCFYDGMDGYAQTWLQFAFPLYVWILVSLIIISSRYSIRVSRLIGSNPIAVLATLLLLSYTKILKIVIVVFSYVKLDYPDNKKVTVWLKDANVPYMEHKHLILTVATFCIVISFFLPYTLLLLFGFKLYSFQWCRKYFHCWLMRFRPLLDSYYAPYNIHHRYWTGFMLLVRCALYIVFSYNSLGETNRSLLAIIVVFVSIGFFLLLMRVYKKMFNNIIEGGMYLNLIILSTVTLASNIIPALVYTSVGITFATFISVCVYHLCIFYMHKTWLNFKARFVKADTVTDRPLLAVVDAPPDERIVTKSVVEVREPLES